MQENEKCITISRSNQKLMAETNRKNEVEILDEYSKIDTAQITIPPGFKLESGMPVVNIESKFGKFSASVNIIEGKIYYIRKEEHYSGRFPAKNFIELADFYEKIYKADHTKIVLLKQE